MHFRRIEEVIERSLRLVRGSIRLLRRAGADSGARGIAAAGLRHARALTAALVSCLQARSGGCDPWLIGALVRSEDRLSRCEGLLADERAGSAVEALAVLALVDWELGIGLGAFHGASRGERSRALRAA